MVKKGIFILSLNLKCNMENKRIYVVEDMGITRAMITNVLKRSGFLVTGSTASAEKAWSEIQKKGVDLVLLDINLKGEKNGLWLAKKIRATLNCAIVYLTAYGSKTILEKIHDTEPDGYIMKPFNNPTLLSTIKVACRKFEEQKAKEKPEKIETIIVKTHGKTVKLQKSELVYLQSESNYVNIHTLSQVYKVRGKLSELMNNLDCPYLYRIHRRYAVNAKMVTVFGKNTLVVANENLPISGSFDSEGLRSAIGEKDNGD